MSDFGWLLGVVAQSAKVKCAKCKVLYFKTSRLTSRFQNSGGKNECISPLISKTLRKMSNFSIRFLISTPWNALNPSRTANWDLKSRELLWNASKAHWKSAQITKKSLKPAATPLKPSRTHMKPVLQWTQERLCAALVCMARGVARQKRTRGRSVREGKITGTLSLH